MADHLHSPTRPEFAMFNSKRSQLALLASLILASTALSRPDGVEPGKQGIPTDAARRAPACGMCHFNAGDPRPQVSTVPSRRILAAGEAITLTTSATGGVVGTEDPDAGGFLAEVTAGTLTPGANTKLGSTGMTISHDQNEDTNNRTWTYGFKAPNAAGLVEVYSVVNTTNAADGNRGDAWAFNGFDNTATVGTPVRLYVLAQGVQSTGPGCPDGFGNFAVLGSAEVPAIGNSGFSFDIVGASPDNLVVLYGSFNDPSFQPLDLALIGLPGCFARVQLAIPVAAVVTSSGSAERGEGTGLFSLPIPNDAMLVGLGIDFQAAYIDPSALTIGRLLPVTVTNGLRIVVQ